MTIWQPTHWGKEETVKLLFILFMVAAFLLGWLSCETGLLSQGAVEWAFPWIVICAVLAILVWFKT